MSRIALAAALPLALALGACAKEPQAQEGDANVATVNASDDAKAIDPGILPPTDTTPGPHSEAAIAPPAAAETTAAKTPPATDEGPTMEASPER